MSKKNFQHFDMNDLGEADLILQMKINRSSDFISLSQSYYTQLLIDKFGYSDLSPISTFFDPSIQLFKNYDKSVNQERYAQIIRSLMYLSNHTRSDIAHAILRLSRHTNNISRIHWIALERIFSYLKGTIPYCLRFIGYLVVLEGYNDASWILTHLILNSPLAIYFFLMIILFLEN